MNARRAVAAAASILVLGAVACEASPRCDADPTETVTVDGRDYPVCHVEDCSDVPNQVGVWFDPDTGDAWWSLGETSVRVEFQPHCDIGCGLTRPGPS